MKKIRAKSLNRLILLSIFVLNLTIFNTYAITFYSGVGAYAHSSFFSISYHPAKVVDGISESAVKADLNEQCGGSCDSIAIVNSSSSYANRCGAVVTDDDPFYANSQSGYGSTEQEAIIDAQYKQTLHITHWTIAICASNSQLPKVIR